jgi:hypothetical protein
MDFWVCLAVCFVSLGFPRNSRRVMLGFISKNGKTSIPGLFRAAGTAAWANFQG